MKSALAKAVVSLAWAVSRVALLGVCAVAPLTAQSPSPETGATLFPGGGVISYRSVFGTREAMGSGTSVSARPTFEHEGRLTMAWGFRRDFQLTIFVPVRTLRREPFGALSEAGGTGFGDVTVAVKYRVLRRDSRRGTTQVSLAAGPKLPTGRTRLRDSNGTLLPVPMQPGSGSVDGYFNVSATYTGLFNIKRLVADESFTYLARSEGTQQMRLGNFAESRFWLSYRPYQSRTLGPEWFIGPLLLWQYNGRDHMAGNRLANSGGNALSLGVTTYFSPRPGIHLWFEATFPVAQHARGEQRQAGQRYGFGITRQFRFPFHK